MTVRRVVLDIVGLRRLDLIHGVGVGLCLIVDLLHHLSIILLVVQHRVMSMNTTISRRKVTAPMRSHLKTTETTTTTATHMAKGHQAAAGLTPKATATAMATEAATDAAALDVVALTDAILAATETVLDRTTVPMALTGITAVVVAAGALGGAEALLLGACRSTP
jgi:hypothetical protein